MTTKSIRRTLLGCALMAILLPLVPAASVADDECKPKRETLHYDLRPRRHAPVVMAPALFLPTDSIHEGGGAGLYVFMDDADLPPVTFSAGLDEEGYGVTSEMLGLLLENTPLEVLIDEDELSLDWDGERHLDFTGSPPALVSARRIADWMTRGLTPSLQVTATLLGGGDAPVLLAAGRARLQPGAWTGVYRQVRATPLTVEWDIEIAQESTAMYPVVVQVPEGEELYLRYHPGEKVSVIELWTGTLVHLDVFEVDLSGIRNLPEAGGPGRLQLPQTAAYRTYTAFAVPADRPVRRELAWDGPSGPVRLVLDIQPPGPTPEPIASDGVCFAVLRAGAAAGAFDFDSRPSVTEKLVERVESVWEGQGSFSTVTEGFLYYEGEPEGAALIEDAIDEAEQRLLTHHLRIRVLGVGSGPFREALLGGRVALGTTVDPDVLTALVEEGGGVSSALVDLQVLNGIDASFRVGKSVLGLHVFRVEVAQQAAGSDPEVGAAFDGLAGNASVTRTDEGYVLDVHARFDEASPEAGQVELVHRPPVGMGSERESFPQRTSMEKVTLPLLGGGSAVVAQSVVLPEAGRDVLVDVVVRGGETFLVLARLVP